MSIGEFAKRSRLWPKALRLYDQMGLLVPARVDSASGYRFYDVGQLEPARLVAALRQLEVPLAEIRIILGWIPRRPPSASPTTGRPSRLSMASAAIWPTSSSII
jgi:protein phosphatase